MPMGPLELADRVGLDICLDVAKHLDSQVPDKVRELVENGRDRSSAPIYAAIAQGVVSSLSRWG